MRIIDFFIIKKFKFVRACPVIGTKARLEKMYYYTIYLDLLIDDNFGI